MHVIPNFHPFRSISYGFEERHFFLNFLNICHLTLSMWSQIFVRFALSLSLFCFCSVSDVSSINKVCTPFLLISGQSSEFRRIVMTKNWSKLKSGFFVLHWTFICKHHMTATFHHGTATLIGPQRTPPTPRTTSTTYNPVQTLRLLRFTSRTICTFCKMAVLSVRFLYVCPNVQNVRSKRSMERGCYYEVWKQSSNTF